MILMGHSQHHPSIQWIWKSYCQPKHKVFFWLLLKDRLSTRNILKRKNMTLQSYSCVLCAQNIEESVHRLFLQCEFAKQCWEFIEVSIPPDSEFPDCMYFLRDTVLSQFYMEAAIVVIFQHFVVPEVITTLTWSLLLEIFPGLCLVLVKTFMWCLPLIGLSHFFSAHMGA